MVPRIATICHVPIYSYGVCIAIGLLLFVYMIHRDNRTGNLISAEQVDTITLASIIASFIGGKLYTALYMLTLVPYPIADMWHIMKYSGLAISGSVIAAVCVGGYLIQRYRLAKLATLDLFTQYAPIVHAWGRLGCFIAGCCYGSITTSPICVVYTHPESWAPLGIPLHPTQLYAALGHMIIFGLLYYMRTQRYPDGYVTAGYLMSFAILRGILDLLRSDYTPHTYGISGAQVITIIVGCIGVAIYIHARYHAKHT